MIKGKEGKQGTVNKLRQRQRKQKHVGRVDNKVGKNTPHTQERERVGERVGSEKERTIYLLFPYIFRGKKNSLACQLSPLPHKSTAIYFSFPVKVDRANIYPLARSL